MAYINDKTRNITPIRLAAAVAAITAGTAGLPNAYAAQLEEI